MANIIYGKLAGNNDAFYGKWDKPIRMFIQAESNKYEKESKILSELFIVEKSNRFGESVIGESDFGAFMAAREGERGENDSVQETFKKFIEHVAFMKEFTITKEMLDDAKFGMGVEMKNRPGAFVRSYYKTRERLAEWALANATTTSGVYNRARIDLACNDGQPLFSSAHPYALPEYAGLTQSNYFCRNIAEMEGESYRAKLEILLAELNNKVRNFESENRDPLGYTADTIIIPGNRPVLEMAMKAIAGTERTAGSSNNDINTQYGNWSVVVLPTWKTSDDRFMVMSSEANKNLIGNLFFNRVPLNIMSEVDIHTRNYIWNGYCRFGIGFSAWKHIALFVDGEVSGATEL